MSACLSVINRNAYCLAKSCLLIIMPINHEAYELPDLLSRLLSLLACLHLKVSDLSDLSIMFKQVKYKKSSRSKFPLFAYLDEGLINILLGHYYNMHLLKKGLSSGSWRHIWRSRGAWWCFGWQISRLVVFNPPTPTFTLLLSGAIVISISISLSSMKLLLLCAKR